MSVGLFSDHVEHVQYSMEPQWCVPYTLCCRLLRPLAPHPHSCFRGPSRMTKMSLYTCLHTCLETIKLGNLPISPFEPWQFSWLERPRLPRSARMHSVNTGHFLPKEDFLWQFFNDKISLGLFWAEQFIEKNFSGVILTPFDRFSFFLSNCSCEWKHDKIYLPTINQWYMMYLKWLDH